MSEVELILAKLKIVSETEERGMYLCDKEHSKLLLDYITNLQQENERLKHKIKVNEKSRRKMQQSLMKEIERLKEDNEYLNKVNIELSIEKNRLNNIIIRTTKYVGSLSSKGRGCEIYADIKRNILMELKGDSSNV